MVLRSFLHGRRRFFPLAQTLDWIVWHNTGSQGGAHVVELKMAVKNLLRGQLWIRENYVTQAFKKWSLEDPSNVEKDPCYHFGCPHSTLPLAEPTY